MPDIQELHWTNQPKAERIRAIRLGYTAQTVYPLALEPRAALDHATPLYTALTGRYSEESCRISPQNQSRLCQILWEAFKFSAEFC